jgi:hypothetical protein
MLPGGRSTLANPWPVSTRANLLGHVRVQVVLGHLAHQDAGHRRPVSTTVHRTTLYFLATKYNSAVT